MAKKTANPADAFRKAQRARELKKNKEARKSARESQTVKRDTRELEDEIKKLTSQSNLDSSGKSKLESLQSELAYVTKTKESYVAEHPEARDRVFRTHKPKGPQDDEGKQDEREQLYDESGRLRDPTRSIYYDPVYNPFGVPPPGMAYKERTPEESEEEEDEDDDDSEDDIVMPEGPPPGDSDVDSDDSDDIPLPPGPPPPRGLPIPPPPMPAGPSHFRPPQQHRPAPQQPPLYWSQETPFLQNQPYHSQPPFRPLPSGLPQRPPPSQDPLSDAPTQTYQGYQAQKHGLPQRPPAGTPTGPAAAASATISSAPSVNLPPKPAAKPADYSSGAISAAPVMRDLRKEATAFAPRAIKKKKAPGGGVTVNAAPGGGDVDEDGDQRVRKDENEGGLMGTLRGVLGGQAATPSSKAKAGDDDYQKFLDGLGDIS